MRSLEKFVQGVPISRVGNGAKVDPDIKRLEISISQIVGFAVSILPATQSTGALTIRFDTLDEGQHLLSLVNKRYHNRGDSRLTLSLDFSFDRKKANEIVVRYQSMDEIQDFLSRMKWL